MSVARYRLGIVLTDLIETVAILSRGTNDTNSTANDIWSIRRGRMVAELDGSCW
jgi:hypothetical protein